MLNLKIERPQLKNIESIHRFFEMAITDTYFKEGIGHLEDDLREEIEDKKTFLQSDFDSNGEIRFFLVAYFEDTIVGTIAIGPTGNFIVAQTNGELRDFIEVGTVYVHPEFQQQGIGNELLKAMHKVMQEKGITQFCLDSGYARAQQIWKKKFGEPAYFLENFWGDGFHHSIWKLSLEKLG